MIAESQKFRFFTDVEMIPQVLLIRSFIQTINEILQHFMRAQLPDSLIADFFTFFDAVKSPIAVRSTN